MPSPPTPPPCAASWDSGYKVEPSGRPLGSSPVNHHYAELIQSVHSGVWASEKSRLQTGSFSSTLHMSVQYTCKCSPCSIPGWTVSRIGVTVSGKRQTTDTCCGGDQLEGTMDEGAWHSTLYSIAEMEPPRFRCSCNCSSTADCAKHLALAEVCTIALGACSVCEGTFILTYLSAANRLSKRWLWQLITFDVAHPLSRTTAAKASCCFVENSGLSQVNLLNSSGCNNNTPTQASRTILY